MLFPREPVFDDSTPDKAHAAPDGFSTGFTGRDPEGYGDAAESQFPDSLLIPSPEWQARIEEKESSQRQLSHQMMVAGLPCKDQSSTNYCWGNAPVHADEIIRVQQNEPMVILSPASVCAPVKGFRNVGGWGLDALKYISDHGVVPVDKWPANAIDRKYYTEANKELAKQFRVVKWLALQPRNINQLVSLLLRNIPVPVGFNWWGHEVTAYDAIWVNGTIGIRIRNSWGMKWGHLGFGVLQGSKMLPDDAVAPLTALPG